MSSGRSDTPRERGAAMSGKTVGDLLAESGQSARAARAAQARWKCGDSGYYVCNVETGLVVRGPFRSLNVAELRAAEHEPPSMAVVER